MIMLKRLAWCPYWTIVSMDSPQRGASATDKYTNLMEAATILDPFDIVLQEAILRLNKIGISDLDPKVAEEQIKPYYEMIRHGLAFDWVVNSCVAIIVEHYPFSPHIEYGGTKPFIEQFTGDEVFAYELERMHSDIYQFLNWVFEGYVDRSVYKRMSAYAGTTSLVEAYEYSLVNPPKEPFEIPLLTAYRINYAILFMEMLTLCVGYFNRKVWTDRIQNVKDSAPGHEDLAIVVGGENRAFAYGDLNDTGEVKWHALASGISVYALNTRVDRTDIVRVIPDEMTFFRFDENTLYIDESLVPQVKFTLPDGSDTGWLNPKLFPDYVGLQLDVAMKMQVKYEFPQDPANPKTISLKGAENTVIKDKYIVLDKDGIGETQIAFRANVISFKIADPEKKYPFTFFSSKKIETSDTFAWLT